MAEASPQLTLFHASPSRSSIVHWMLEELGEPYKLEVLNLRAGDQRKPAYLAINPMGKVPTLKDGDVVVRSPPSAAISPTPTRRRSSRRRSGTSAAATISSGCSMDRAALSPR
jgi:hypothetical protein